MGVCWCVRSSAAQCPRLPSHTPIGLRNVQLRKFRPTGINFVTAEHVASGDAQIVAALCGRLFSTHHGLRPPSSYTVRPLAPPHSPPPPLHAQPHRLRALPAPRMCDHFG